MFIIGLIGKYLNHTFSEEYFKQKFQTLGIENVVYKNFPLTQVKEIESLIDNHINLIGFNVTIPFKEKILPFLKKKSKEVSEIGAVNTVLINRIENNYELLGYNTDCYGFEKTLLTLDNEIISSSKALIFGTGGSSKAVAYSLKKFKIPYLKVSRIKNNNYLTYSDLNQYIFSNYKILINCTPVGMYPDISNKIDIPYNYLTEEHILIDLIYNPEMTQFLFEGEKKNATTINGNIMLREQAEEAWKIFKTNISN